MLDARYVLVGDDFRFGRNREGNYASVEEAGERLGYIVRQAETLALLDERISSSRVRAVLAAGDFKQAQNLLGHEYFIMGP